MHRNEETGQVLNLVMAWAEEGTELKVDVPLVFKGVDECPGLKKGFKLSVSLVCYAFIVAFSKHVNVMVCDSKCCTWDLDF